MCGLEGKHKGQTHDCLFRKLVDLEEEKSIKDVVLKTREFKLLQRLYAVSPDPTVSIGG